MKKVKLITGVFIVMAMVCPIAVQGAVIGYTTDSLISHYRSLDDSTISQGRSDLINDGHTLVPVNNLTVSNVSSLDTLVVGVVQGNLALSSSQVDVIESFVLGGGNLVFLGENNINFHANNVMVGGRFGITYPTSDPADTILDNVALPRHAIMEGPYGQVDVIDGSNNSPNYYGSMSSPGPYGRSILDFIAGNSAAVVIERGAIAAGSGIVVAFAEINIWDNDQYFNADNRALWRNTFAYVPEPTSMLLFGLGGLLLRKRKK